jgi:hypothetical protein
MQKVENPISISNSISFSQINHTIIFVFVGAATRSSFFFLELTKNGNGDTRGLVPAASRSQLFSPLFSLSCVNKHGGYRYYNWLTHALTNPCS